MNADHVAFQRKASIKRERDLAKHCESCLRGKKKKLQTHTLWEEGKRTLKEVHRIARAT